MIPSSITQPMTSPRISIFGISRLMGMIRLLPDVAAALVGESSISNATVRLEGKVVVREARGGS